PTSSTTGGSVTLAAGSGIGASGSEINPAADSLDLSVTGTGGIYILESDGASVSADTVDSDIEITSTIGDLDVATIDAGTGNVTLTATAGAIEDAGSSVTGATVTLTAEDGIGASGGEIATSADVLDLSVTGAGDVFVTETDDVDLTVDTFDGSIEVSSGGELTATNVAAGDNDDSN